MGPHRLRTSGALEHLPRGVDDSAQGRREPRRVDRPRDRRHERRDVRLHARGSPAAGSPQLRRLRCGDGAAARRRRAPARAPGHRRAADRGAPGGRRGDRAQPAPGHLGCVDRPGPAVPGADARDQRGAAPRQPGHRVAGGAGRAADDVDGRSGRHPPGRTSVDGPGPRLPRGRCPAAGDRDRVPAVAPDRVLGRDGGGDRVRRADGRRLAGPSGPALGSRAGHVRRARRLVGAPARPHATRTPCSPSSPSPTPT